MRTLLRGVLLALVASGPALTALPAQAAFAGVLTAEYSNASFSGARVATDATITTFASSHGLTATFPGTLWNLYTAPPSGQEFVGGTTYPTGIKLTATDARLSFSNLIVFKDGSCTDSSSPNAATGTLKVLEATYADGALTAFAADYRATCTVAGDVQVVAGSIRLASDAPWVAIKPTYTADQVPVGATRTRPLTLTAVGTRSTGTLGTSTLSGPKVSDYAPGVDGCTGRSLAPGESCEVGVTFAPAPGTTESTASEPRIAFASLDVSDHVAPTLRVRLASQAFPLPAAPSAATAFPAADGVGIALTSGSPSGDTFVLQRRTDEAEPWTDLAEVPLAFDATYLDTGVAPGQHAFYRAAQRRAGWTGPWRTFDFTRPEMVSVPSSRRTVSFGAGDPQSAWVTMTDGTDGDEVRTGGDARTITIEGRGAPTGTSEAADNLDLYLPRVSGPGTYRQGSGAAMTPQNCMGSMPDAGISPVLVVRDVLYAADGRLVLLDGSWVGLCNSTARRVEVRFGVDAPLQRTAATTLGTVTTGDDHAETRTVTVSNKGPQPVTAGQATTQGPAAADWDVVDNRCDEIVLQAGTSCEVDVSFATSTKGVRPAVLEVAQSRADGALAPAMTALAGFGASAPTMLQGHGAPSAVGTLLAWSADAGGAPVTTFEVQRRVLGTSAWTDVVSLAGVPAPTYVDRGVLADKSYAYRVRGTNSVGTSPWREYAVSVGSGEEDQVVVSGATVLDSLRGLFLLRGDSVPPARLPTNPAKDYRDPAVRTNGYALVASVGDPRTSTGEYDLWAGTLGTPATRRLTSQSGGEWDAAFSPDGTVVAYTRRSASGGSSVWTVPFAGGTPRLVRTEASHPAWARDGRSLVVEDDRADSPQLLEVQLGSLVASEVPGTQGASDPAISLQSDLAFVNNVGDAVVVPQGSTTQYLGYWRGDRPQDLEFAPTRTLLSSLFSFSGSSIPPHAALSRGGEMTGLGKSLGASAVVAGPLVTLADRSTLSWSGVRAGGFSARTSSATPITDFGPWVPPAGWSGPEQATTLTSLELRLAPGAERCVRVTARDGGGLWSSAFRERCVVRPADDRSLTIVNGARRTSAPDAFLGTLTSATAASATLRSATVTARRVGLVVGTCPECGSVRVSFAGRLLGTVSLRSATTRQRLVQLLPALDAPLTGRVTVVSTSARRIDIDGLVLRRSAG